jgi:hypothetical protein
MSVGLSRTTGVAFAACIALAGCVTAKAPDKPVMVSVEVPEQLEWQKVASTDDEQRIERVGDAWKEALDEARAKGFGRAIDAEGELLLPGAALPRPAPTPGSYSCRAIKIGTKDVKGSAFNAYKPFFCYVEAEGDLLTIVKQTGSQRPAGRLYPDSVEQRLVFLGTLALGTEETPLAYGEVSERDMAGILERVAPFRFRLVIPWPRTDSKLDVIELVPVTNQP